MRFKNWYTYLMLCLLIAVTQGTLMAQSTRTINANSLNRSSTNTDQYSFDNQGRAVKKDTKNDSLQHRDKYADSITIYYRYYDSTRNRILDSSVSDFYNRYPLAPHYHTLGNYGGAAQSYFFNPVLKAGWDPGLHQYDPYKFTHENTKFYSTTRPYTELTYLLGSKAEQLINILLTQNKKSNFNYSFEYRFSSAPGYLKTQNNSHNNFRITMHYQGRAKQYEAFFVFLSNKAAVSENGGLQDPKGLETLALNDPYELETRLGRAGAASRNPFNTTVNTGNTYKESSFLLRHHYDLGKKDSTVTDSITYHIFYPRFRIEHTFKYASNQYGFSDNAVDTANYRKYMGVSFSNNVTGLSFADKWKEINNEFALYSFPDKNNQSQFLKLGVALQNLTASFTDTTGTHSFYNLSALGEYRNRTRNQKWDLEANGQLWVNGFNAGDYSAYISMKRELGRKLGYLNLGFQNVNRSPSFNLNSLSNFYPLNTPTGFNKENYLRFFAHYGNPKIGWNLHAEYFAVSNYIYYDSFFSAKQEATLFNVLHLSADKKFKLARHWNWYTEIHLQQTTGGPPVNIPFFYTRNRIAFEGNFFTNLFISTGVEIKYHSAYKADNYSPIMGQFFYQNSYTVNNRPEVAAYLNFRIKSFKSFIRIENLNTINPSNGFAFDKRNFFAENYAASGLWTRFGIWWNFVN